MSEQTEQKCIKTVCPHCNHTSYSPNKFLDRLKFWKYETVSEPCADVMDCIRYLRERLQSATLAALNSTSNRLEVKREYKCQHCPHCQEFPTFKEDNAHLH